jgi:MerR family redox-sensitive transcriptional activator SoxR
MVGLTIGAMARQAGVAASTLRYYEKVGLLLRPARETRAFVQGLPAGTTPASRWREMANRKMAELDELTARLAQMRSLLSAAFDCQCRTLEDCERLIAQKNPGCQGSRRRSRVR